MAAPTKIALYDWILEIISFAGLIWTFYPLLFYGSIDIDTKIPIHYNTHGQIDGWGGRSFLFFLPMIALIFYLGLSIIDKHYRKFNYPVKVTDENKYGLYRLGVSMMRHIKLFLVLIFAYINNATFNVAIGKGQGLNGFIMTALIASLFLTVLFFYLSMARLKGR